MSTHSLHGKKWNHDFVHFLTFNLNNTTKSNTLFCLIIWNKLCGIHFNLAGLLCSNFKSIYDINNIRLITVVRWKWFYIDHVLFLRHFKDVYGVWVLCLWHGQYLTQRWQTTACKSELTLSFCNPAAFRSV